MKLVLYLDCKRVCLWSHRTWPEQREEKCWQFWSQTGLFLFL